MTRRVLATIGVLALCCVSACTATGGGSAAGPATTTTAPRDTTTSTTTEPTTTSTTEPPTTTSTTEAPLVCMTCTTDGERYLYQTMPEIREDRCQVADAHKVYDVTEADGADGAWSCTFTYTGQPIKADYLDFPDYKAMEAFYERVLNDFHAPNDTWNLVNDPTRIGLYSTFDETKDGGVVWHNLLFTYDKIFVLIWTYTEADAATIDAWWKQLPLPDLQKK